SIVVMPSKREGFGLVALEAIAAGIPVLVTAESGLAELLLDAAASGALEKNLADMCIVDVNGELATISMDWATRLHGVLSNVSDAFAQAERMRSVLRPMLTWENAARQLSADIEREIFGGSAECAGSAHSAL